jgi:hypothetical protein
MGFRWFFRQPRPDLPTPANVDPKDYDDPSPSVHRLRGDTKLMMRETSSA